MTDIARGAQIGVGTLYRNYSDKSELCMEVFLENIRIFINDNNQYLDANDLSPHDAFYRVIFSYFEFKDNNNKILDQVESSVRLGMEFYHSELYEKLNLLFQRIIFLENDSYDKELLRFNADMLFAMLRNKEYIFQLKDRGLSKETLIKRLISMF